MEKEKIKISEYVIAKRTLEGLSLRAFAEKYNISKTQVAKYESGKADSSSFVTIRTFCEAFNISLEKFMEKFDHELVAGGLTEEQIKAIEKYKKIICNDK